MICSPKNAFSLSNSAVIKTLRSDCFFFEPTTSIIIGFVLKSMKISPWDQYVYNCGMFAFSGGVTNWIAIKMLFDKVPGLYGSGVIPSRFVEIRITVKKMVMKNFAPKVTINFFH